METKPIHLVRKEPSQELTTIVSAVLAGAGSTLADAKTLPPAAYTSQAFYDLEVEKLFKQDWIVAGHIAQVPNVGDYYTLDLLGELMVVVRGEDRVRVMSRVCLHRWAPVVEPGTGNLNRLSCPFHKWVYGLDGQLLGAPHMEEVNHFDTHDCKLPEVRSEIVDGLIFITFNADAPAMAPQLAELSERFVPLQMERLVLGYSVDYMCDFNWKIAVETFMECYHHIGAHSTTRQPSNPAHLSWGEDTRPAWTVCHTPLRPELPTSANTKSGLPLFPELSEERRRESALILVYPLTLISTFADRVHVTTLVPMAPNKTRWLRSVLVLPEAIDQPGFAESIDRLRTASEKVTAEDLLVNTMQQVGAASALTGPGRLSHLEKSVWQLAEYVRRKIAV